MIIWGSKAKEAQVGTGVFFCPNCLAQSSHSRMRVSRYFTLYFIPLFPTATLGEYVKCGTCGGQFPDVILTCTREEILKAVEPWSCAQCGNRNPRSQPRCLACGATRAQPPPVPRLRPPPIPTPLRTGPPAIPSAQPPREKWGSVAGTEAPPAAP